MSQRNHRVHIGVKGILMQKGEMLSVSALLEIGPKLRNLEVAFTLTG